jgi:lipid-A-disaccharide synthase
MLQAAGRLMAQFPGLQVLVAQAASISEALMQELVVASGVSVRVVRDQPNEVMAAADALLVASGTATLQAAIIGTPMVIAYKTSRVTYWLARRLIRIPWIGLANIVAQRQVAPELIQQDATAARMATEAARLLGDETVAASVRSALSGVRRSLGEAGASRRAAAAVLRETAA